MDKNILKQLKTDYEDLEIKPSVNLWNQIEGRIEGTEKEAKKTLFHWWKYAAVIVLLISVGGLFYFNSDENLKPKEVIVIKKPIDNSLKPIKDIEFVANPKNTEVKEDLSIPIKSEKNDFNEKVNKLVIQKDLNNPKEDQKITNIEPLIASKPNDEVDNKPVQQLYEAPQLRATKSVANNDIKVKYITANDLIFQRKYSIEQKKNAPENVKRLGIIKLNRITVSPELITIFNSSSNTTDEQK